MRVVRWMIVGFVAIGTVAPMAHARYKEPSWGRFTTRDSIGIWRDTRNVGSGVAYVANNPMRYVDPFGRQGESPAPGSEPPKPPDPSEDPNDPRNDKSQGCGVTRNERLPLTDGWTDPGHRWLDIPDPGRFPNDPTHPEYRAPGHKKTGHYPDGWRSPHKPDKSDPTGDPATKRFFTEPTTLRPDTVPIRREVEGPYDRIEYEDVPTPFPLQYGPGKGKLPSEATCEEIRRCLFECNPGKYILFNMCHGGAANCLRFCGLKPR